MKRILKFRSKNRDRKWFLVNKWMPRRFNVQRGGVSASKDAWDYAFGELGTQNEYVEVPIKEFFLSKKTRMQGHVSFYMIAGTTDFEKATGRVGCYDMIKDSLDEIEVYYHEKKTDS